MQGFVKTPQAKGTLKRSKTAYGISKNFKPISTVKEALASWFEAYDLEGRPVGRLWTVDNKFDKLRKALEVTDSGTIEVKRVTEITLGSYYGTGKHESRALRDLRLLNAYERDIRVELSDGKEATFHLILLPTPRIGNKVHLPYLVRTGGESGAGTSGAGEQQPPLTPQTPSARSRVFGSRKEGQAEDCEDRMHGPDESIADSPGERPSSPHLPDFLSEDQLSMEAVLRVLDCAVNSPGSMKPQAALYLLLRLTSLLIETLGTNTPLKLWDLPASIQHRLNLGPRDSYIHGLWRLLTCACERMAKSMDDRQLLRGGLPLRLTGQREQMHGVLGHAVAAAAEWMLSRREKEQWFENLDILLPVHEVVLATVRKSAMEWAADNALAAASKQAHARPAAAATYNMYAGPSRSATPSSRPPLGPYLVQVLAQGDPHSPCALKAQTDNMYAKALANAASMGGVSVSGTGAASASSGACDGKASGAAPVGPYARDSNGHPQQTLAQRVKKMSSELRDALACMRNINLETEPQQILACPRLRLLVPGAPQGCAWQLNVTSALGKGAQAHVVDINLVQCVEGAGPRMRIRAVLRLPLNPRSPEEEVQWLSAAAGWTKIAAGSNVLPDQDDPDAVLAFYASRGVAQPYGFIMDETGTKPLAVILQRLEGTSLQDHLLTHLAGVDVHRGAHAPVREDAPHVPVDEIIEILGHVAFPLAFLHDCCGVVVLDLNLENISVSTDQVLLLPDPFGRMGIMYSQRMWRIWDLGSMVHNSHNATRGRFEISPFFAAPSVLKPELASTSAPTGAEDIWALGILLQCMLWPGSSMNLLQQDMLRSGFEKWDADVYAHWAHLGEAQRLMAEWKQQDKLGSMVRHITGMRERDEVKVILEQLLDLGVACLHPLPSERITAMQACMHPALVEFMGMWLAGRSLPAPSRAAQAKWMTMVQSSAATAAAEVAASGAAHGSVAASLAWRALGADQRALAGLDDEGEPLDASGGDGRVQQALAESTTASHTTPWRCGVPLLVRGDSAYASGSGSGEMADAGVAQVVDTEQASHSLRGLLLRTLEQLKKPAVVAAVAAPRAGSSRKSSGRGAVSSTLSASPAPTCTPANNAKVMSAMWKPLMALHTGRGPLKLAYGLLSRGFACSDGQELQGLVPRTGAVQVPGSGAQHGESKSAHGRAVGSSAGGETEKVALFSPFMRQ